MLTTWRVEISRDEVTACNLPAGAVVVDHDLQFEEVVCVWFTVDLDKKVERRFFRLYETGEPIEDDVKLPAIGTFQEGVESHVFHLYELSHWSGPFCLFVHESLLTRK